MSAESAPKSAGDAQKDEIAQPTPEGDMAMTIWEHLDELRSRIIRAALSVLAGCVICWGFRVQILSWLLKPYEHAWVSRHLHGAPELQTLSPADVFVGYLQLSLFGAIICSAPVIFYQLWSFISPGLYSREKRLIVPFVFFSTALFLAGVAFAYYVAFPFTFNTSSRSSGRWATRGQSSRNGRRSSSTSTSRRGCSSRSASSSSSRSSSPSSRSQGS